MKVINCLINKITLPVRRYRWVKSQPNIFSLDRKELRYAHRHGFTGSEYKIYDLEHRDYHEYIREFERHEFRRLVATPYKIVLDNKLAFYFLIKNFMPVNEIFCYKTKGRLINLYNQQSDSPIDFVALLKEKRRLIFKKNSEGGGHGFALLEYRNNRIYLNNDEYNESKLLSYLSQSDNFLIEEFCNQNDFEMNLFPYSVNTLRIVTAEIRKGEYDIIYAIQRMGTNVRMNTDNASGGGIFAEIDIGSGRMNAANCSYSTEYLKNSNEGKPTMFTTHPVTGVQIDGCEIPNWESIKQQVTNLHSKISFTGIPMIAWDFALTEEGLKVIEGNTTCGLGLLQRDSGPNGFCPWQGQRETILKIIMLR